MTDPYTEAAHTVWCDAYARFIVSGIRGGQDPKGIAVGVIAAAIRAAVEAEREACARYIEDQRGKGLCADPEAYDDLTDIAEHIRARGEK